MWTDQLLLKWLSRTFCVFASSLSPVTLKGENVTEEGEGKCEGEGKEGGDGESVCGVMSTTC